MATRSQKIRVGAFVIASAGLLAFVLVVFGGLRFWEAKAHYHIVFDGSVMGLEKGAQVYLNGMRIGRVDAIAPARDDLRKVDVAITVTDGAPIHADTEAMLQLAGITGLKVIDLRNGSLTSPLLADGGLITQGATTLDKLELQATRLADQSTQLMEKANRIVDNLVAVSDPKKFAGIDEILGQSKTIASNLARTSATLDAMVSENRIVLRSSLAAVEGAAKQTRVLLDTQVTQLLAGAGDLLGDLRNLVRNNEGQMRSALFDLRQASRNFKELSRDVRQRPSRLLFSKDPGERKLP